MSIITLSEAKLHLRVDTSDEDPMIQIYLDAAEKSASDFLNRAIIAGTPASGSTDAQMNAAIKAACLLIAGHLYNSREDVVIGATVTELPMGSRFLLQPYRVDLGV